MNTYQKEINTIKDKLITEFMEAPLNGTTKFKQWLPNKLYGEIINHNWLKTQRSQLWILQETENPSAVDCTKDADNKLFNDFIRTAAIWAMYADCMELIQKDLK